MIKTTTLAFSALLALTACNSASQPGKRDVEVVDAWVRLPAVPDRPGAAYFTLRNGGPAAVLTAVQSPGVQRIELHDSQMHDGMMHMMPLGEVPLAESATVDFKPGGQHAMLFGMDARLKSGGKLPLTFSLRDGRKVEAEATVVAVGAPSPYSGSN